MTVEDLKKKALRLNPESRAYLARELLAGLDSMNDDETRKLWLDEIDYSINRVTCFTSFAG